MREYWSNSKLADAIRGVDKPKSATLEDWKEWTATSKNKSKIRYWIAEDGLDYLQQFVYFPLTCKNRLFRYVNNRWITKTHGLMSSSLERGTWHELDERILYSLFDELVNFVEIELAISSGYIGKQHKVPLLKRVFSRLVNWRCPEAGLDYLEWAAQLESEPYEYDFERQVNTTQAQAAIKIKELYIWWTKTRPARIDPYDTDEFNEYYSKYSDVTEEDTEQYRNVCRVADETDRQYYEEDTAMLIELIKIRNRLWT